MSDSTRPSPWLPVNAPAGAETVASQDPPSPTYASVPVPAPTPVASPAYAPEPQPATPPAFAAAPAYEVTDPASAQPRRASVLSPYLVNRGAQAPSGETQPPPVEPQEPVQSSAYSPPSSPHDASAAWSGVHAAATGATGEIALNANPASFGSIGGLSASRPAAPAPSGRNTVPRPVEVDEPEVIRPVAAPPAYEILPSTGSIPMLAPVDEDDDAAAMFRRRTAGQPGFDPFRQLGESAVASASLSAAGAPAAGRSDAGVVGDSGAAAGAVPSFGEGAPFVPQFQAHPPMQMAADTLAFADAVAAGQVEGPEVSNVFDNAPTYQDTEPVPMFNTAEPSSAVPVTRVSPWTPIAGVEVVRQVEPSTDVAVFTPGATMTTTDVDFPAAKPWWRKTWVLIVVGAVIAAGLGVLVYRLFLLPEPIILPAPVVTEAAPTPTIDPVDVTDTSDFLAAMPTEVSTLVLTSYEVVEVIGDRTLPARTAEHLILTYGESTADDHFTIHAYQFYNVDDAATAFGVWTDGATGLEDVTANGKVVGERATVPGGAADTIAWRNETAVFVMQGPADELLEFYSYFGV